MSSIIHSPYRTRTLAPTDLTEVAPPKPVAPPIPAAEQEAYVRTMIGRLADADTFADMLFGPIKPGIHNDARVDLPNYGKNTHR